MVTQVVLSIDVEFNINGALTFPATATPLGPECVYRRHNGRGYGLEFILGALAKYRLPGSFFLETLSARFFGLDVVRELATRIAAAGPHELGLHLHPEWRYFDGEGWREKLAVKRAEGWRPHGMITELTLDELDERLGEATRSFATAVGRAPCAFRSGGLNTSARLYPVLARHGLSVSSSIGVACQKPAERALQVFHGRLDMAGVREIPVTSYCDFRWGDHRHLRLLTVVGNTFSQMRTVLERAARCSEGPIVLLTHASEYSAETVEDSRSCYRPYAITMRRLDALCGFLAANRERFETVTISECAANPDPARAFREPISTPARQVLGLWLDNMRMSGGSVRWLHA
jgi:hypothetical protein